MPNIDPGEWGPFFWRTIDYAIVRGFDERTQSTAQAAGWLRSLQSVLPCEQCRANYAVLLEKYPPEQYMATRESRRQWFDLARAYVREHSSSEPRRSWCALKPNHIAILSALAALLVVAIVLLVTFRRRLTT